MRSSKAIELAFTASWKTTQTMALTQGRHLVASTSQNFVRIGLVSNVPHDSVMRRVEDIVQSNGQFNRAQVGTQMSTRLRDAL